MCIRASTGPVHQLGPLKAHLKGLDRIYVVHKPGAGWLHVNFILYEYTCQDSWNLNIKEFISKSKSKFSDIITSTVFVTLSFLMAKQSGYMHKASASNCSHSTKFSHLSCPEEEDGW